MPRKILILLLIFLSSPAVFAEVVVLKTGESFEGTIIERTDDYVKIQTGGAPVYLSMDQIQEITDTYPSVAAVPETRTYVEPAPAYQQPNPAYAQQPQQNIPLIDGKDGQFYYQQAKIDFQNGNIKQSMQNLSYAASLGFEDSEGLKDQLAKAMSVVEKVESQKSELKKAVDKLDPGVQTMISRIMIILGGIIILVLLVKFLTREKSTSDVSPLLKPKPSILAQDIGSDVFIKAGPNKRVCAYLIDSCLIAVPALVVQFWVGSLFSTLVWLIYLILRDCVNGQSIGKKIVAIKVVDLDNQTAGPNQTVMRNLFWIVVCVLPLFHPYLAFVSVGIIIYEYVALIKDPEGQRFGDKISLTRVADLRPMVQDWKFIFFSLLAIVAWIFIYTASAYVLAKAFNRTDLLVVQKGFQDPLNRFSMMVPSNFNQAKDAASDNLYVFNRSDNHQTMSVMVIDREDQTQYTDQQMDQMAVSFLALKLKTTPQQITANASMSNTTVSGRHAAVFAYDTDQGKNISVCFLQGKRFFEINFMFKQGDVDQAMILKSLMGFRVLDRD